MIPGLGRSPGEGNGVGALQHPHLGTHGSSPRGVKQSDTAEAAKSSRMQTSRTTSRVSNLKIQCSDAGKETGSNSNGNLSLLWCCLRQRPRDLMRMKCSSALVRTQDFYTGNQAHRVKSQLTVFYTLANDLQSACGRTVNS